MTITTGDGKKQISTGTNITITSLQASIAAEVLVTKTDTSTPPVETVLTITTDYTINSDVTAVTLLVALTAGETATASLNIPDTQETDYVNSSAFLAETVEDAFDKVTNKNRQQQDELDRSIKFPISETAGTGIEAPDPISGDGDKFWKWNDDFTAIEYSTLSNGSGIGNVVDDLTPQYGGNMDQNSKKLFNDSGDVVIVDGTDLTKVLNISLSGATTGKTMDLVSSHTDDRVITIPNATDTLVGKATTDTLTNKTIDADGTGNVITNVGSSEIKSEMITGQTTGTIAVGDSILFSDVDDSGNLKEDTVQGILDLTSDANIVQVVNTQTGANASTSTTMPYDDTIPQNTEGAEFMTLSITPTNSSNILHIDVVGIASTSTAARMMLALFQDSTASALASTLEFKGSGNETTGLSFRHKMTAGTTSSTTFKVRMGANSGTTYFNANSSGRLHGGVLASSITITEIKV